MNFRLLIQWLNRQLCTEARGEGAGGGAYRGKFKSKTMFKFRHFQPFLKLKKGLTKGVGPSTTSAWPGQKQPDIPVEVDTVRLETSCTEAGVLKKLSLAGIAKLSRLKCN
jgi:hypothetical protein